MRSRAGLNSHNFNYNPKFKKQDSTDYVNDRLPRPTKSSAHIGRGLQLFALWATSVILSSDILQASAQPINPSRSARKKNNLQANNTNDFFNEPSNPINYKQVGQSDLSARISSSPAAQLIYAKNENISFERDKAKLVKQLRQLSKEKVMRCKIDQFLLDGGSFVLDGWNDVRKKMGDSIGGFYSCENKSITLFIDASLDANLKLIPGTADVDALRHELDHAFISMQNFRNNRYVMCTDSKVYENASYGTPCMPDKGASECAEIVGLLDSGFARAHQLLDLLDNPQSLKKPLERRMVDQYLSLCDDYKPKSYYRLIDATILKKFQADKLIHSDLTVIGRPYMVVDYHEDNTSQRFYITALEHRDAGYFLQCQLYEEDDDPRAALSDLIYNAKPCKKKQGMEKITEMDAYVYQTLEQYPELLDFLFPGLREYHLKRTDKDFQQCMRPS